MAITTWTQKQVVDMFPELLTKSTRGFTPDETLERELGQGWRTLPPPNALLLAHAGPVTIARHRWRSPYATKDLWSENWERAVGQGLAERADGGWRITAKGRETAARLRKTFAAYLARLDLPREPLGRAVATLEKLVEKIPADAERGRLPRLLPLSAEEARSEFVRLRYAIQQLWGFRDDCHIGAWDAAGYEGPALDVLSQIWDGKSSTEDVAKALVTKQEPVHVERNVDELVRRGDITREGDSLRLTAQGRAARDAIERETDRRYFIGWPEGRALGQLGDDLRALLDALP
jgi:hypothetical protein